MYGDWYQEGAARVNGDKVREPVMWIQRPEYLKVRMQVSDYYQRGLPGDSRVLGVKGRNSKDW